jgi:glutamine amidotransferase
MGNLRSVEKAFHKVGAIGAFVTEDPAAVAAADKAVLPGDGSFDSTMRSLRQSGVDRVSLEFIHSGKPFLGICVGMQVLMTSSEEGEQGVLGLDVIPGRVLRFQAQLVEGGEVYKVPQIGWNGLQFADGSPLGAGLDGKEPMTYFLHSYYCMPDNSAHIAARTEYGVTYASALHRDNVWATQFHPEKSGKVGLTILTNFARL